MRVNKTPTFPNNSALGRGIRVVMSGGFLVAASSSQDELGTLTEAVLATDTLASVVPFGEGGVRQMVCSAAISQYAVVYAANSGKITSTVGTSRRGIALEAGSGDGAIIPVLWQSGSGAALG